MSHDHTGVIAASWTAQAKAGKEAELLDLVTRIALYSRGDEGNIDYEAHEVQGRPGSIAVYERWASAGHLQAHTRAAWTSEWIPRLHEAIEGTVESTLVVLTPLRAQYLPTSASNS